ncbi:SsgA family sporulation/cell division regulator [Kitasatospora azatica]|uniref:SsgA family sporulation/cell division regulator n=1 Tax=Kitasatospora azatica TaxID=58347 RepID=UPI00068C4799|nr:SsgA family sporulation/cell division regulator [Kitasatospora azatica]
MSGNSSEVTAQVELDLLVPGLDDRICLLSTWAYDARDPLAVHVDFMLPFGGTQRWTFARELLTEGLDVPAGGGDVLIEPEEDHDHVLVLLRGTNGSAVLRAEEHPLREFLDRSYASVPSGSERCADELERWLDEFVTGEPPEDRL